MEFNPQLAKTGRGQKREKPRLLGNLKKTGTSCWSIWALLQKQGRKSLNNDSDKNKTVTKMWDKRGKQKIFSMPVSLYDLSAAELNIPN